MKYILYSAFFFCFAALISCGENEAGGAGLEPAKASLPTFIPPANLPANTTPLPANASMEPANNNAIISSSAGKLNPAHGQPGHRCDVSVGAPLPAASLPNVKPAALTSPVINSPVQATPALLTKPIAAPVVAAGINPAHGQPGHRCDVSVGAALPKEDAATAKTITANSPLISPPVANTPVIQTQPPANVANTTFVAGLNPAHGQAGHRCDIEVGKPLNSTPKKN